MTVPDWVNVVTLLGLVTTLGSGWLIREAWFAIRSRSWPSVEAGKIETGIYTLDGAPPVFKPHVRYEYTVEGMRYESRRLRFGSLNAFHRQTVSSALGAAGSAKAAVFYDPGNPARSCLVAGLNEWTIAAPALLLPMGLVALYFGILGSKAFG